MAFVLGTRSKTNLQGVHPDLVKVVELAIKITKRDFTVIEGVRDYMRQKQLWAEGKTQTMNSRHIPGDDGYGKAVDLLPLEGKVAAWDRCPDVAAAMFEAARRLGVKIRWGGDWNENGRSDDESFYDGPHFELRRKEYP